MSETINTLPEEHDELHASWIGGVAVEAVINHLDEPLQVVRYEGDALTSERLVADGTIARGLHDAYSGQRSLIAELPSQEEGLNMARVDAYRRTMGAPNKMVKVLSRADFDVARLTIGDDVEEDLRGAYAPTLDVYIIQRDMKSEAEHGAGLTESIIVHEAAHASSMYSTVEIETETQRRTFRKDIVNVTANQTARVGFAVSKPHQGRVGLAMEEGYAEYERGRYVVDELGLPDGFIHGPGIPKAPALNKYMIPTTSEQGETKFVFTEGAFAAATLELLVNRDPDLVTAMRDARHSVEGLREVAKRMNAIVPGVYQKMRKIDLDSPDAAKQGVDLYALVAKALED